jgi:hypothetical protein
MPTYNPKDMAYVLQMSKSSGKYTPEEMALMQDINRTVAGGAMTGMPMQGQPQGQPVGQPMGQPQGMPQGQPMNRLAQIQAAANQVLAGGENPEGSRMANIARYFQGRQ